jgi:hypothetical protein
MLSLQDGTESRLAAGAFTIDTRLTADAMPVSDHDTGCRCGRMSSLTEMSFSQSLSAAAKDAGLIPRPSPPGWCGPPARGRRPSQGVRHRARAPR